MEEYVSEGSAFLVFPLQTATRSGLSFRNRFQRYGVQLNIGYVNEFWDAALCSWINRNVIITRMNRLSMACKPTTSLPYGPADM